MEIKNKIIRFGHAFKMLVVSMLCVCFCASLGACGKKEEQKETKYNVAIRVGCSDGTNYTFPVGTDEKHITIQYDGTERTYWVKSYNLPDHPRYGGDWFSPSGEGANVFEVSILYGNEEGWLYEVDSVYAKGRYSIAVLADSTSDLWYYRSCRLYITVE